MKVLRGYGWNPRSAGEQQNPGPATKRNNRAIISMVYGNKVCRFIRSLRSFPIIGTSGNLRLACSEASGTSSSAVNVKRNNLFMLLFFL